MYFINTPRNEIQSACICAHGSCAAYCALPSRTAAPNTYLYYIMIICLICE
nr:MAG TPA: hypothetical protein [Caudoviricetes sp.]